MRMRRSWLAIGGAACAVAGLALSPAFATDDSPRSLIKRPSLAARGGIGSFTPAAADPRVAAVYARAGLANSGFRFTPAAAVRGPREVTVAVRAVSTAGTRSEPTRTGAAPSVSVQPIAYNLGVAVGWKRFAVAGDIAQTDAGGLPGSRQKVDVGVSYNAPKWSGRLQVERDKPLDSISQLTGGESVSFDLGGSVRVTRNIDVTAGVRYRADRDRLDLVEDRRRDAQAVYIGTAFKF
jgi:hypothetical protein